MTFFKIFTKDLLEDFVDIFGAYKFAYMVVPVTWILSVLDKYFFSDVEYLGFLLAAIVGNTISKWWNLIKDKEKFSIKVFGTKLIDKAIKYFVILSGSHILESYTIKGTTNDWFSFAPSMLMAIPIVLEIDSMFSNAGWEIGGKIKEIFDHLKVAIKKKDDNDAQARGGDDLPKDPML